MPKIRVRGLKGNEALGLFLTDMEANLAWETGFEYLGHSLRKKSGSWLLVIKARQKKKFLVAFVEAHTVLECYRLWWGLMHVGQLSWRKDRYQG